MPISQAKLLKTLTRICVTAEVGLSFARSAAFSASRAASRLLNSSIRASNVAISASFSALDNTEESNGGATHTLTHIRPPDATAFTIIESICRINPEVVTRAEQLPLHSA